MGKDQANIELYQLEISKLSPETLKVVRFSGREEISRLFEFEIELVSTDPDLNFADILNKPAKFTLRRYDDTVEIHGLIADFQQGNRTADWIAYRAVLMPRIWTLSLNYQSRIFQNMTVQEIVTQVLKDASFVPKDFRFTLTGTYKPREYCVQYRETDLAFISRLLESEGIYFFFEHDGGKDVLVMTDDRSKEPAIVGENTIKYKPGAAMVPKDEPETIRDLVCHERIVTGKVILKDYNYRTPEVNVQGDSQLNKDLPGVYYDYGEHFRDVAQGKALAKVRNQEIECGRKFLVGKGNCVAFRAGYTFTLTDHFRKGVDDDYLITAVKHAGSQAAGFAAPMMGSEAASYENEFMCIPASVQYRPPRATPEPKVAGIMTARVETAGGDYAYLDDDGRYRVKMHFDLSSAGSGKASLPIRLAQPYSGTGYGMHYPLQDGAEMVWACVDGNVDRPIGLSSVPNATRNSPVVAQNKSQNIIRTASGSELLMDDRLAESVISMKTPDAHTLLMDDKDDKVEVVTTGKNTLTMDDKNKNITIQTTNGHLLVMDDQNDKIVVQSKNGHRIVIDEASGESITLADANGDNVFVIDISNNKLLMTTKNGGIELNAPNGTIDIKATTLNVETTGDSTFKAANTKIEAQQDYSVKAANVTEEASMEYKEKGMNVTSEASMEHKSKGMNLTVEAGVNMEVKGNLVTVQSAGPNTIKGMPVMIN